MLWFAVRTKPQQEHDAYKCFRRAGIETFFPHVSDWVGTDTAKARLIKKPLLISYMFIETGMNLLPDFKSQPWRNYVLGLVRGASDQALPIPANIIGELQGLCDPLGEVQDKGAHKREVELAAGDRVRFSEDSRAFWGLYGEVKRVLGNAILVELEKAMMGQTKATVPVGYVQEVFKRA